MKHLQSLRNVFDEQVSFSKPSLQASSISASLLWNLAHSSNTFQVLLVFSKRSLSSGAAN